MGLLDGMMGNASKIDAAKIQEEFSQVLAEGERVEHAYQLIRDYFVFFYERNKSIGINKIKNEYSSFV